MGDEEKSEVQDTVKGKSAWPKLDQKKVRTPRPSNFRGKSVQLNIIWLSKANKTPL